MAEWIHRERRIVGYLFAALAFMGLEVWKNAHNSSIEAAKPVFGEDYRLMVLA
jgi:hypothetical protein